MKKIFLLLILSITFNIWAQDDSQDFNEADFNVGQENASPDSGEQQYDDTQMPAVEEVSEPYQDTAQVQTYGEPAPAAPIQPMLNQAQQDLFNNAEAKSDLKLQAKKVDLRTVLATGLNQNVDQKVRNYLYEKINLNWDDTFESFWFPNLKITISSGNQLIESIRRSSTVDTTTPDVPAGRVGLELGEYNLFNWGRDYLVYVNDKSTYERNKQKLVEEKRLLRFNLIAQYFRLIRFKNIQRSRQEQLRHTSFIHRLARQKLALKKITTQEYYQTRAEYLRSQTLFQEAQAQAIEQDESLARLLGDKLETTYKPTEELKFIGINNSVEEAIKLALQQSPYYRNARLDMENSQRSFQKAQKDNMPLPKINLNLGAYNTYFSRNGRYSEYEGSNGNRDLEVVASVNFTWNLIGEGGLFNSRDRQRAYLDKRISEENFNEAKRALSVKVRTIFRRVRFYEAQSEVAETQLKNAQSAFDSSLDSYTSGRSSFALLKIALERIIEANINYETAKFDHLLLKLELADLMGLEDFPGSNFENIAEKI